MTKIKRRLLSTQSDERLACLVQAGHEPAFEALVHRYRRPLLRYCQRLCHCDARGEEALQQALLNAWIALRSETEVREPRAWLYRIARNAAINSMRGEAREGELPSEPCDGASPSLASAASVEDAIAFREALTDVAALPRMQREVMVRAALAGHSHEEVASDLGISDDAVRGLLYRARSTLRAGLTAITPAPLLAWASRGAELGTSAGGAGLAEIAAGGGTAGLAGLAVKAGAVALSAGIAVGGAIAAQHRHAHRHAPAAHIARSRPVALGEPGSPRAQAPAGAQARAVAEAPVTAAGSTPARSTPAREIRLVARMGRERGEARQRTIGVPPSSRTSPALHDRGPAPSGAPAAADSGNPLADHGDSWRSDHGYRRLANDSWAPHGGDTGANPAEAEAGFDRSQVKAGWGDGQSGGATGGGSGATATGRAADRGWQSGWQPRGEVEHSAPEESTSNAQQPDGGASQPQASTFSASPPPSSLEDEARTASPRQRWPG